MCKLKLFIVFFTLAVSVAFAQQKYGKNGHMKKPSEDQKLQYAVTPTVSYSMVGKNQLEIVSFGTLVTGRQPDTIRNVTFAGESGDISFAGRRTLFGQSLQLNWGVSERARVNVGLEASFLATRRDMEPANSPLLVFQFRNTSLSGYALNRVGPRVRFRPSVRRSFVYQSQLLFATASEERMAKAGDIRAALWQNQFFTGRLLSERFYLAGDLSIRTYITHDLKIPLLGGAVTVYAAYSLSEKMSVQGLGGYGTSLAKASNQDFGLLSYSLFGGPVLSFNFTKRFALLMAYQYTRTRVPKQESFSMHGGTMGFRLVTGQR